jgi:hypothetical protein
MTYLRPIRMCRTFKVRRNATMCAAQIGSTLSTAEKIHHKSTSPVAPFSHSDSATTPLRCDL